MMDELNQEVVEIYSVSPLSKEDLNLLFEKFPFFKKAKIINKIKPQLIAGIVIKTKDKIIDLSLNNRLLDLKKITYEIGR